MDEDQSQVNQHNESDSVPLEETNKEDEEELNEEQCNEQTDESHSQAPLDETKKEDEEALNEEQCTEQTDDSHAQKVKITFKTFSHEIFEFEVHPSDKIRAVKSMIEERRGDPAGLQILIYDNQVLNDDDTIEKYDIERVVRYAVETMIEITIKDFITQETFKLDVQPSEKIRSVHSKIAELRGCKAEMMHLVYKGKVLFLDNTVEKSDLRLDDLVLLVIDNEYEQLSETTKELKELRDDHRDVLLRNSSHDQSLGIIVRNLNDLRTYHKNDLSEDILAKFRVIDEQAVEVIDNRYERTATSIGILDSCFSNRTIEQEAINLSAKVKTVNKLISRMEDHITEIVVEDRRKKGDVSFLSFFYSYFYSVDTAKTRINLAEDCSILDSQINDVKRDLMANGVLACYLTDSSKGALNSVQRMTADLLDEIAKAKTLHSNSLDGIKICLNDFLNSIDGIREIFNQSTNEFFSNEMIKQISTQRAMDGLFPDTANVSAMGEITDQKDDEKDENND